jgi:hypothetical protein
LSNRPQPPPPRSPNGRPTLDLAPQLDLEELQIFQSHAEDCRRCLVALEEKTRREAATVNAANDSTSSALAAEKGRLEAEEASLAVKEKELAAKSDEAAAAIGLETADVTKEKEEWIGKQTAFEAEIAELMRQLELKKAEV